MNRMASFVDSMSGNVFNGCVDTSTGQIKLFCNMPSGLGQTAAL